MTESWQKEHYWLQNLPPLVPPSVPRMVVTGSDHNFTPFYRRWVQCRRINGSARRGWMRVHCWWQLHWAEILFHKGAHRQTKWFTVRPYWDMTRCIAVDHCQLHSGTWCNNNNNKMHLFVNNILIFSNSYYIHGSVRRDSILTIRRLTSTIVDVTHR